MIDNSVLQRLRAAGLRPTIARIAALQAIGAAGPQRLSAEDVYRCLLERGTRAGMGTVYRVVHELHEAGLLLREWDAQRKAHYREMPAQPQLQLVRLVCPQTGRTVSLADPALHDALTEAARRQGVSLEGLSLWLRAEPLASADLGASEGAGGRGRPPRAGAARRHLRVASS